MHGMTPTARISHARVGLCLQTLDAVCDNCTCAALIQMPLLDRMTSSPGSTARA